MEREKGDRRGKEKRRGRETMTRDLCLFRYYRVRPSDRIKMSVSKVTSEQYERLNSDLTEIRRMGKFRT